MTEDEKDAYAAPPTGVRNQKLVMEGWMASHADQGAWGPHVALRASDRERVVIRSSEIPAIVRDLTTVGERIDALWARDGDRYVDDVLRHSPDPDHPDVIRRREIERLEMLHRLGTHLPEVIAAVLAAVDTEAAFSAVAAIIGEPDETEVLVALANVDLFAFTQGAMANGSARLATLRAESS